MFPSSRELTFAEPISRMGLDASKKNLFIITDAKDLHKVNLESLDVEKSVSLSNLDIAHSFDYYTRPFALKDTLAYVEFSKYGKEYILEIAGKIKRRVTLDQNAKAQVTKAVFSEDKKLLLTGNDRGFAYMINTSDGSLTGEFNKSADAISALAISPNNVFAARASFEKTLSFVDLDTMKVDTIDIANSIIEMMEFIDDTNILAITRDSKILKIDILQKKIIQEESFGDGVWPSVLCLSHSKKFAYVGTRESSLYVFRTKSLQNYYHVELKKSGITSMVRSPKYFILGFQNGEVFFYNHREYEDKFILAVELKNIQEAISYFDQNIFLMSHRQTKGIYDYWLEKKRSISTLLANGDIDQAQQLANPFSFHPKCAQEFEDLEALQPELQALNRYIRSKSYVAAYHTAEQNSMLKDSAVYTRLEKIWMETLQKAQIILARDPVLNKEEAQYILKPFAEVPSKEQMIRDMIKNASSFSRATNAVKNKNFSLYFKLVDQYAFLRYAPLFKKVHSLAEKIQNDIIVNMKNEDYMHAMELSKALSTFPPYAAKSKYLEKFANALIMIDYHLKQADLLKALKIKDELRMQGSYTPLVNLEKKKETFQKSILLKIKDGNIDGVFEKIKEFLDLQTCKKETTMVMKYLYIEQMRQYANNFTQKDIWIRILQNYFRYYRLDKVLVSFLQEFELEDIAKDLAPQNALESIPPYQENIIHAKF